MLSISFQNYHHQKIFNHSRRLRVLCTPDTRIWFEQYRSNRMANTSSPDPMTKLLRVSFDGRWRGHFGITQKFSIFSLGNIDRTLHQNHRYGRHCAQCGMVSERKNFADCSGEWTAFDFIESESRRQDVGEEDGRNFTGSAKERCIR